MKLKKFKKAMLTLLLIIMGCFLCACNKQSEKEQQKAVDDSQLPELKIGVNMLKPYFYMNENGDYIGIDAEIAKKHVIWLAIDHLLWKYRGVKEMSS